MIHMSFTFPRGTGISQYSKTNLLFAEYKNKEIFTFELKSNWTWWAHFGQTETRVFVSIHPD